MTLLQDPDQASLLTDPSIVVLTADGRQQSVIPFKLGQQSIVRRDAQGRPFPLALQPQTPQQGASLPVSPMTGTPISIPTQVKKMQPVSALPQLRNGSVRPPGLVTGLPSTAAVSQSSPTNNTAPATNGVNGVHHSASAAPQLKTEANSSLPVPNGIGQRHSDLHPVSENNTGGQSVSPVRPKSQNQHHIQVPNGYHLTAMNGYPAMSNGSQYLHANTQHNSLSIQQMQTLKSAFATVPSGADMNTVQANGNRQITAPYIGHVVTNGTNFNMPLTGTSMNLKLPPVRPMQWSTSPVQRGNNGVESSGMNGSLSPSPSHGHTLPVPPTRTPSANGSRAGMRGLTAHSIGQGSGGHIMPHSMSPLHQHSPSPMSSALSQVHNQPSPRLSQTPMTMVSPLLQHQQPVGSSQSGY